MQEVGFKTITLLKHLISESTQKEQASGFSRQLSN
jgi:hypothetical protein